MISATFTPSFWLGWETTVTVGSRCKEADLGRSSACAKLIAEFWRMGVSTERDSPKTPIMIEPLTHKLAVSWKFPNTYPYTTTTFYRLKWQESQVILVWRRMGN